MIYDQETNQKVHLHFDLEFEDDPLDEGNYYSVIEKNH